MLSRWMIAGMMGLAAGACHAKRVEMPELKTERQVIRLDTAGEDYRSLLREGETSHILHSGLVELAPNESVGEHSSKQFEEIVIPLSGTGEMTSTSQAPVAVTPDNAIYCPPWSTHNITNTGDVPLRYVYVVARTEVQPSGQPARKK